MQKLFISIDVNDNIAGSLDDCVRGLPDLGEMRIVPAENYHITAHFIGYVSEETLTAIQNSVGQVALRSRSFVLRLKEITLAPPDRTKTMLWAIFEESEAFVELSDNLQKALRKFSENTKERIPHITLVRSRKPLRSIGHCPNIKRGDQIYVNQITLMESMEVQGGVYYKPLAHFSLGQ